MMDYIYELDFTVRDYECDMQGVVNNSIYMNYLEHARHEFLKEVGGKTFAELTQKNILPMVYKAELEYKKSLKSNDNFVVKIKVQREGQLKAIFLQDIFRKEDNQLILKAKITAIVLENGKPIKPDALLRPIVHQLRAQNDS